PPNRYVPGQYYEIRVWAFLPRMQTNRYINAQTEIQTILSRMVIRGTHFMRRVRCVDLRARLRGTTLLASSRVSPAAMCGHLPSRTRKRMLQCFQHCQPK